MPAFCEAAAAIEIQEVGAGPPRPPVLRTLVCAIALVQAMPEVNARLLRYSLTTSFTISLLDWWSSLAMLRGVMLLRCKYGGFLTYNELIPHPRVIQQYSNRWPFNISLGPYLVGQEVNMRLTV